MTWNNAPAIGASGLGSLGSVAPGTWVDVGLSGVVTGNGTYSFAIRSNSSNNAVYSSEEGENPPQLVIDPG